jgi:hypothetical protein
MSKTLVHPFAGEEIANLGASLTDKSPGVLFEVLRMPRCVERRCEHVSFQFVHKLFPAFHNFT